MNTQLDHLGLFAIQIFGFLNITQYRQGFECNWIEARYLFFFISTLAHILIYLIPSPGQDGIVIMTTRRR